MAIRLSFSLLIVMLLLITSARVQDSVASASTARDKSFQWRVHLALQLVKHPELSGPQVQVVLDAISLSTPKSFEESNASLRKLEAEDEPQSLTRRMISTSSNNQKAEPFSVTSKRVEERLLKLYYDVSLRPLTDTKATFRNASSKDKSDLWRTHMALFLAKRPDLNESQKEVIVTAILLATTEFFEVRSTDPTWNTRVREPLRSLEKRIVTAFSWADATRIFATLGDHTRLANENAACTTSALLRDINYEPLNDFNRVETKDQEENRKNCDCSTESDYCPLWKMCRTAICTTTQSGCGTFWAYSCNGSCQ